MFGTFRTYVKFNGLELFKNGDCPDTNGGLLVSPNHVKLNEGLLDQVQSCRLLWAAITEVQCSSLSVSSSGRGRHHWGGNMGSNLIALTNSNCHNWV